MKRLAALICAVIAVICCCGALLVNKELGAAFGITSDPFAEQPGGTFSCTPQQCPPGAKWVKPVPQGIVSGFRGERPDHDGTDLGAPRGTTVLAASAGTVTIAECTATLNGAWYGCGSDGSPAVSGCGWHVAIAHAGGLMTVYCHLVRQPDVSVGDTVDTAQAIGVSGSTGNSSGPHLHLEVHTNTVWESASAVDPAAFFADRGLEL